jgi:hypothetical protein
MFSIDGVEQSPAVTLNGSGIAVFTTAVLTAGTHAIGARYIGDATFAPSTGSTTQTVNPAGSALVSYSDAAHSTLQDRFASAQRHVYMKGTGLPAGSYRAAYYDGSGALVTTAENIVVGSDGILLSDYKLNTNTAAAPGTWYVLVQPSSGYTNFGTAAYAVIAAEPAAYGVAVTDQFIAEASAIPELAHIGGAVSLLALAAVIYGWLRRRTIQSRKGCGLTES